MNNSIKKIKKKLKIEKSPEDKEIKNINFISKVAPMGGISFRDEKIVKTGDGYEACLYVYKYPNMIEDNWMAILANQDDAIVTFDISNMDKNKVIRQVNRSMEEQSSRYNDKKATHADKIDAQKKYDEATLMHNEITSQDEVMKLLVTRLYVASKTLTGLDEKINEIKTNLDVLGYKTSISLNETKEDWQALFKTYKQQIGIKRKVGQEILSSQLAIGNPFNFSNLDDPHGFYFGDTYANTGGTVFLDLFRITNFRMNYNAVLFGKPGSGKSTTLKKIFLDRASRGDTVRVFDVTGEYQTLTKKFGGKVISLDGSNKEIINALQIRKTDEDMNVCYSNHIAMISAIYRTLNKDARNSEVLTMEKHLRRLYERLGIVNKVGPINNDITALKVDEYPTFSDFLMWIRNNKNDMKKNGLENTKDYGYVTDIELVIENLVNNYGHMFDGYSTIQDIYNEQIISFDISKLSKMKPEVFETQLFVTLALCWDNCVAIGSKMKKLYSLKEIKWEDIERFIILIDESHKWLNTDKIPAVEQVTSYAREARKFFGGICLASQSIRDFVKDDATNEVVTKMKTLFELCTYKFIMQQDINCKEKLKQVFSDQITSYELNKVSKLAKGETILMITSDRNLFFKIQITDEENEIFEGGA